VVRTPTSTYNSSVTCEHPRPGLHEPMHVPTHIFSPRDSWRISARLPVVRYVQSYTASVRALAILHNDNDSRARRSRRTTATRHDGSVASLQLCKATDDREDPSRLAHSNGSSSSGHFLPVSYKLRTRAASRSAEPVPCVWPASLAPETLRALGRRRRRRALDLTAQCNVPRRVAFSPYGHKETTRRGGFS